MAASTSIPDAQHLVPTHGAPQVGVAAIVTRGNRVLLLKRKNAHGSGCWSTPGGHLEYGESPEECATRETKEETNLDVAGARFRAVTNDLFEAEGKHYITLWMECDYLSGEAVINAAEEMSEVGWFAWSSLPQPLFLPLQNLLDGKSYP
jgi:8-oxo-dGTP diphosphatase